jgi:uncharacterized protein involved in outer membrane biogenesis
VAIRVFLPPEKLKALAIEQADKSLHRKLEIESVSFGLLSGLRIDGLRLSESPDFSKGEFPKAASFTLSPEWLPLLHKQLIARQIELAGASVNVIKGKDGRFNFSDFTGAAAAPPPPSGKKRRGKASAQPVAPAPAAPAAAAAPLALAVGSLRLRDITLHYADRQNGSKADLAVDDVAVDGFSFTGPFSVAVEAKADYAAAGKRYAVSLAAQGKVDLGGGEPSKINADFPSIALTTLGKKVTIALRFENAAAPKIALSVNVPALDAKFLNDALGVVVPAGLEVPAVKAEAALAYAAPSLQVSSFKVAAAGAELSGSASVADVNAKTPKLKLDAAAKHVELAALADADSALKPLGLAGVVSLSIKAAGTTAAPKVSGSLSLDGVAAKFQGQTIEKVTGKLGFTEASVDMPQLTGRLNGGDFKLKIAAANSAAPTLTVSGWLSLLDLGALQKLSGGASPSAQASAPAAAPAPAQAPAGSKGSAAAKHTAAAGPALKTSGDITVDKTTHPNFQCGKMTLTWNLTGVTPDMKGLSGTAKLAVGAGQTTDILSFAAARGGLVRAMVVPLEAIQKARALHIPGFSPPDMQNIPFTKIIGNYSAARGVIAMQPFQFDSPALGMTTTGTVDMGAQTANLKVVTKSTLGEIDLAITGPLSDPSVRPNVSQQIQSTGKQLLQNQGKALLNKFLHR